MNMGDHLDIPAVHSLIDHNSELITRLAAAESDLVLLRARLDTATQARELAFSNEGLAHLRKRMVGVVKIAEELDHEDPDQAADAAWLVGTVDDFAGAWEGLMAENRALGARLDTAETALHVAGGDFLRIRDRLEHGHHGDAASIAYDSWYRCAVAAPGFPTDTAAALCVEGTEPAADSETSSR